ncbi:hypothetical protein NP493_1066g02024 [Ridgeia piscesae]|uniref:Dynein regulatory complex protein 1 n=1 Tax=Ridgeia piscesae TaxID=27915 RepID=A0AAD9KHG7_RIDPI|nr:hypothetical protein NP493_1066g02024 [Ridgeia piscesae]
MSASAEDEEIGPSIDSADPEERIAARRLRITKRLEQLRRAQLGEDDAANKDVKEELSISRKQMEESRHRLLRLVEDGYELVTNIRDATDAREGEWRTDEDEIKRQRKDRLDAEAKSGSEKFDEITKKWESALQKEIPQDLQEMLTQQKSACDAMIDEKNKLITDFQLELKSKDDQYVKDLKRQAEDIDLIIERMDEQVKELTRAYREELGEIETAFVAERSELLEANMNRWKAGVQSRLDKELDYLSTREKRVDDYEDQLRHLRVQDAEEYNMVKIKLETDVQILQQQLQQMKATYQLNQEKLEYNFQVLRKRDEENTITKSQQKRKITRLQDVLTNMRIKLAKQEKQYKEENQQLTDDYKRITEQFKEIQHKSMHFMATDQKKFHEIWLMNEEECKELVKKLLEEERVIYEQQLGLPWTAPDLAFTENVGPITNTRFKKSAISAHQVAQEAFSVTLAPHSDRSFHDEGGSDRPINSTIFTKYSPKLVKQILELLGDEAGFLIESKLNKLLAPLERDERCLMRLDAIFTALSVDTEDDIYLLAGYFINHGLQKPSAARPSSVQESTQNEPQTDRSEKTEKSERDDKQLAPEDRDTDREVDKVTGSREDETDAESTKVAPHGDKWSMFDLIHPNEVYKALRQFVEDHREPPKTNTKHTQFSIAMLDDRDNTEDATYWATYPAVLSDNTEKVWDALVEGLEKYNELVTSRSTLITETDALRQQNAELRMLLHQYVNSRVNQELEIPPTRVLQLELNPPH